MRLALEVLGPITHVGSGEHWPPERLATETRRRASVLRSNGLGPGHYALITHGATPSFFADLFAVWQTGACAVCVNSGVAPAELANLVEFCDPTLVLTATGGADSTGLTVPIFACQDEKAGETVDAALLPGGALDDEALILFTSGTTGEPKGVVHTFRSLMARIALNQAMIGSEIMSRSLCLLPTHFGHGLIGNCLTPLFAGCHLILSPGVGIQGAAALANTIDEHRISFMSSVPALWKLVLKLGRGPQTGSLRRLHIGSAPLSADLWKGVVDWSGTDDVQNMFGITETANWLGGASAAKYQPADGLIGTMWGGAAIVRHGDGYLNDVGEGEICVQSPSLMTGYHRRPDLTDEVLRDGWFCTGDIGRIDRDGTIWLTGRLKHEINRAGMKVHPEDIDLLLERHADVVEACAFGIPDEIGGEIVGVAVRLSETAMAATEDLRDWCSERIRRECVPERWYIVPEIPKTDRGKVNRKAVMRAITGTKA